MHTVLATYKSKYGIVTMKRAKKKKEITYVVKVHVKHKRLNYKRKMNYVSMSKANKMFDEIVILIQNTREDESSAKTIDKVLQTERSSSYETTRITANEK